MLLLLPHLHMQYVWQEHKVPHKSCHGREGGGSFDYEICLRLFFVFAFFAHKLFRLWLFEIQNVSTLRRHSTLLHCSLLSLWSSRCPRGFQCLSTPGKMRQCLEGIGRKFVWLLCKLLCEFAIYFVQTDCKRLFLLPVCWYFVGIFCCSIVGILLVFC